MQQDTFEMLSDGQIARLGGRQNITIDPSIPKGEIHLRGGDFGGAKLILPPAPVKTKAERREFQAQRKAQRQARRGS